MSRHAGETHCHARRKDRLAQNTGDFTIAQFTDHTPKFNVKESAKEYAKQGDERWVYLAIPNSFQPLRVKEAKDGKSAIVYVCQAATTTWDRLQPSLWDEKHDPPIDQPGSIGAFRIVTEDGKLVYDYRKNPGWPKGKDGTQVPCDQHSIPYGYFDPPPTLPQAP